MSTIKVTSDWIIGPTSESQPHLTAQIKVECYNGDHGYLNFQGPDSETLSLDVGNTQCKLIDTYNNSDLEMEFNGCDEYFATVEDVSCNADILAFYTGVPTMSYAGMALLIAGFVVLAYKSFQ